MFLSSLRVSPFSLAGGNFHACSRILLKPTEENDMEKQRTYITDISRLNNFLYLFFAFKISP